MLFYRATVNVREYPGISGDGPVDEMWRRQARHSMTGAEEQLGSIVKSAAMRCWDRQDNATPFVSELHEDRLFIGIVAREPVTAEVVHSFLREARITADEVQLEETTYEVMNGMMWSAQRRGFIDDSDSLSRHSGLPVRHPIPDVEERVIRRRESQEALTEHARTMLSSSLAEELDRIFAVGNEQHVIGHPVHYIIESDSDEFHREALEILVSALVQMGRLPGSRVMVVDHDDTRRSVRGISEDLYSLARLATIVFRFREESDEESRFGTQTEDTAIHAGRSMSRHGDDTLTIFALPKGSAKLRGLIEREAGNTTLIRIAEDVVEADGAHFYLEARAQKGNLNSDPALFQDLKQGTLYSVSDLERTYERWKTTRLKTVVYPQYASVQSVADSLSVAKPRGSAYEEFQSLIGLREAKENVMEILDYFKAQKLFADRGLGEYQPSMHMVFSGNPGTAKTTAARLVGQILKENGILSEGTLHEVGRGDLVGKYVGWTARIVKEKFSRAKGGVLFIDEAYALVDDRAGMFGDEAINTIVQEMENMREDIVVIFAGYPQPMEEFIGRNPGLRSRIAAHISFPDYTSQELLEITKHEAGTMSLELADDVAETLLPIYDRVVDVPDFGNGRYARNMLERARMRQSARLLAMPQESVTERMVRTLQAEDFVEIPVQAAGSTRKIGFCA